MSSWKDVQTVLATASKTLLTDKFSKINSINSLISWTQMALNYPANPLVKIISGSLVASLAVFVLSISTNNYSWVDKSWSILPIYYAWILALHTSQAYNVDIHPRLFLMAGLVTIWGIRLTFNFWRKGGYSLHGEDYRWPIIRKGMHPLLFQVFNFVFIAIIQNLLLAALLSPVYVVWTVSYDRRNVIQAPAVTDLDALAFAVCLFFLVFEAVADQQQWQFHKDKAAAYEARNHAVSGDVANGFLSSGLWKYSRHPNFFAEQAFWWSLSLFVFSATGKTYGWWLGGAAALTALFQGSTWLTEKISAAKYPAYADYQHTTSMLLPWFPKKTVSDSDEVMTPPAPREEAKAAEEHAVAAPVSRGRSVRGKTATSSSAKKTVSSASRSRSRPAGGRAVAKSAADSASRSRSRSKSASRAPSGARRRSTRKSS